MTRRRRWPVALTIAGSDSGGGAGIQADLKAFAAVGVHGASVITCLTAQNPKAVLEVEAARPEMVRRQLEAVFAELPPRAVKTGMLLTAEVVAEVARFWSRGKKPPLVVDPVMVATSGGRLLEPAAVERLKECLLPLATLITPNLEEAERLTGWRIREPEDLRAAARLLGNRYRCAVLIKGGHLTRTDHALDLFYDRRTRTELLLSALRVRGISTHGTGCTYSAAITGYLALGCALPEAVRRAKEFITQAIAQSGRVGRHTVLNCFAPQFTSSFLR